MSYSNKQQTMQTLIDNINVELKMIKQYLDSKIDLETIKQCLNPTPELETIKQCLD